MQLFTPVNYAAAGDELRAVYDDIMQATSLNTPPNWATYLGANPKSLQVTWAYVKQTLYTGKVSRVCKDLLIFGIAIDQRSAYCAELHACSILKLTQNLSYDELLALIQGKSHGVLAPRDRTAIDVLLAPAEDKCRISEADVCALKAAGFGDAEIVELMSAIALGLMLTSMTRGGDIPIDAHYRVQGFHVPWEPADL